MHSLTVSDHVMIAHSLAGEVFGPAQRLHGATYVVEVEFRRAGLDANGLVCDIGRALQALRDVLAPLNLNNLDAVPEFRGHNTTTEFLAGEIFRRMAARVAEGAIGSGTAGEIDAMRVVLRESPVAWAAFEGPLR